MLLIILVSNVTEGLDYFRKHLFGLNSLIN